MQRTDLLKDHLNNGVLKAASWATLEPRHRKDSNIAGEDPEMEELKECNLRKYQQADMAHLLERKKI